jgi:Kef-type K+ transport system membrane component KefB/Trk K+ transport system NAD-binding subunit
MENSHSFGPLLLVVALGFVVPFVLTQFKKLRLPVVVGEIAVGILIGRSGMNLIPEEDPILTLLSEFGLVFLMFISGLEIDFSNLGLSSLKNGVRQEKWGPLPLAVVSFILTLAASVLISLLLVQVNLVKNPWMMSLILSTTSLGVVVPVLKERGLISGQYGQSILISALIADFATMLLITIVVALISQGLTLDILLIAVLFLVFFLIHQVGLVFFSRFKALQVMFDELSHATTQIKMRGAFTIMLVFVVLSEVLGTEIILGAFLAGAILSLLRSPNDTEVTHQVEAIGFGFLIPIFFIMVGVHFDLRTLLSSSQAVALVPVLLGAAILVKIVPIFTYRLRFNWRETLAAGALLSARLSLIIAASAIGLRLGVITEPVNAAIILVAVITVTLAPFLFVRLAPEASQPAARPVLVAGADDLGLLVAERLRAHNEHILIIDADEQRIQRARNLGFPAELGRLDEPHASLAALLDQAQAIVCTHRDEELNYSICRRAHTAHGIDHLVAKVDEPSNLARFRQLGVQTMNAAVDLASMMALLVRNPAAFALMTRTDDNKEMVEVVVGDGYCLGKTLRELNLPGDVLVLAVRRNGELLIPHGNTQLERGDHVTLVGSLEDVEIARQLLPGLS